MANADVVLFNGKIYSVLEDDSIVRGTAAAVSDGKILEIGEDDAIKALAGADTEMIDCGGNTVLPGMCDAHCHPSVACASLDGVDLFGIYRSENQTADDIIDIYKQKLKEYVDLHPEKDFIRGAGWIKTNFTDMRWPDRHDLDEICSDRPVVLESFCQHNIWVNTRALELGHLDENTPDVETGEIVREKNHYPSGLFLDAAAMFTAKASIPGYNPTVDECKSMFLRYQDEYASKYGVTMVTDCMLSDEAIQAYKELAEEGKLNVRMRAIRLLTPEGFREELPVYIDQRNKYTCGEDFRIDTIKIFGEGNFAMSKPYNDEFCEKAGLPKGFNGPLFWSDDDLTDCSAKAMKAGYSVHIHAMGDASVSQAARCLSRAQEKAGLDNTRSVIAHLMLVSDETAETMGKAHIIANVQPRWMIREADVQACVEMIGRQGEDSYPFRKLVDAGCIWAAGTDFPVTPPPSTIHEIHCWMNRSCFPGGPEWEEYHGRVLGNEKPASLAESVKGLTWGGAYQMRMENYAGTIEKGKSADMVILDTDLENTPKEEIYKVNVMKTLFKGKVVYEI